MATLTVWKFSTPTGANNAVATLQSLQKQELINVYDTVRSRVQPGTSALFVLTSGAVVDRVHEAFVGQDAELLQTNLSGEEEALLRATFAA